MWVTMDVPSETSITTLTILPHAMAMISQDRVACHSSQSATSSNVFSTPDRPQ